jgi:hypothetical protein
MANTTEAVRRDIEMTRERMSSTLAQLERKVNVMQQIRDHPWPALGIALGAGVLLGVADIDGSARTTLAGSRRAGTRFGIFLDEIIAGLLAGLGQVAQAEIDRRVEDWKAGQMREELG